MNPADISNALLYGIPLVTCLGYGYESLMACRGRPTTHGHASSVGNRPPAEYMSNGLRLAVACTQDQKDAARRLVQQRYQWRGYEVKTAVDDLCRQSEGGPHKITFTVEDAQIVVGTLTLGLDNPHGLLAEATHEGVIDEVRASGRKVCELTQLAIAETADSRAVLASLLGVSHVVCTMNDITDVFIEVNPRHVHFYSRVLGFVVAAAERVCERVRAPSVLLRLELKLLEERLDRMGMGHLLPATFA